MSLPINESFSSLSLSPLSSGQPQPAPIFHKFSELLPEIQVRIWKETMRSLRKVNITGGLWDTLVFYPSVFEDAFDRLNLRDPLGDYEDQLYIPDPNSFASEDKEVLAG